MYSFMNDYSEGAHPRILELLGSSNFEKNAGYGLDIHSDRAKGYIKKLIGKNDVDIHFIPGGTQTNLIAISSFLRPHQCVIAADTAHINVHETGAIEATGHKVFILPTSDGKLTPLDIEKALAIHTDEHMVQPKMVYISNTTELGTIYTKEELTAISKTCRENGLILYLDGARLGSALTCSGTKNGALLGEALVIVKEELKADFRFLIKQRGAMMAKGFVIGIQFEALFKENLFFELANHANKMADQLAEVIKKHGFEFYVEHVSNQIFPIFPNDLLAKMEKEFVYLVQYKIDEYNSVVRFVTSWATDHESIDAFKAFLEKNCNQ